MTCLMALSVQKYMEINNNNIIKFLPRFFQKAGGGGHAPAGNTRMSCVQIKIERPAPKMTCLMALSVQKYMEINNNNIIKFCPAFFKKRAGFGGAVCRGQTLPKGNSTDRAGRRDSEP